MNILHDFKERQQTRRHDLQPTGGRANDVLHYSHLHRLPPQESGAESDAVDRLLFVPLRLLHPTPGILFDSVSQSVLTLTRCYYPLDRFWISCHMCVRVCKKNLR